MVLGGEVVHWIAHGTFMWQAWVQFPKVSAGPPFLSVIVTPIDPQGVLGRGFCLFGRIGSQYPPLIIKCDNAGQRSEKLYFEAVWKELLRAGQTFNYHNK